MQGQLMKDDWELKVRVSTIMKGIQSIKKRDFIY